MLCGVETAFLPLFVQPCSTGRQETDNSLETPPFRVIRAQPRIFAKKWRENMSLEIDEKR